jgi:hypothetical protein
LHRIFFFSFDDLIWLTTPPMNLTEGCRGGKHHIRFYDYIMASRDAENFL